MPRWIIRDRYGRYQGDIVEDDDSCCAAFILGLPFLFLIRLMLGAVYTATFQGVKLLINQFFEVYPVYVQRFPYREVDWFYKVMIIGPIRGSSQAIAWLIQATLNSFVLLWQSLTDPGFTPYPNFNYMIGLSAILAIILGSLSLMNRVVELVVKTQFHVFVLHSTRASLRWIIGIVVAPALFLVMWMLLGVIFSWLFQKAPGQ